ncbi:MAG: zinc ribbon domain-containing protein [Dehalococcoidia bacterium]|nr:zinc ribbon domain-containing protein [Dehalococcoidia bacterium]
MNSSITPSLLFLAVMLVWVAIAAAFIGLTIWGSKFAYNHGKQTGNVTISIILIAASFVVGLTFIPGIFHLIGTTKAQKRTMNFGVSDKERIKVRCPNCKQLVDEIATFCSECGTKLD